MVTMNLDNLQTELVKYGTILVEKYKSQLRIDETYATGETADSLNYIVDTNQLKILASNVLEKIDKGTDPGDRPRVSDIISWAKAKKIRPRDGEGRFIEVNNKSIFWMSKNIADSIEELGTIKRFNNGGSGIIDFVYRNQKDEMLDNIFAAYSRDVQEMIDQIVI
jgi:hypothetical protein